MAKLTPGFIKGLKSTDKHRRFSDGDGLSLVVRPNGSKAWQVRIINPGGSKTDKGIGAYPDVGLAAARREAKVLRERAASARVGAEGPAVEASTVPTFSAVAEMYIKANAPTWRHPKTEADTRTRLRDYAYPAFGDVPINLIRRGDALDVIERIWTAKPAAAKKLRQRMRAVFDYALDREYVEVNPAAHFTRASLPPTGNGTHFRALPYQDVSEALTTISSSSSSLAVRLCFKWLVLTAARSGEARGARWQDIDLDARVWTIPGDRMKAGVEHRVPLSHQAMAVLDEAAPFKDDSGLVFPGVKGKPLSDMTLTKVLRDNGLADKATVHGFRTSFKTWCMETTDTPWAVGEAALAHTLGNSTEQAYARTDLFDRRRDLMQQWADFTNETGGE